MKKHIDEWQTFLTNKKYSANSITQYIRTARAALNNTKLVDYESDIEKFFVASSGNQQNTISTKIHALTTFQKWLIKNKIIDEDREIDFAWLYSPSRVKSKSVKFLTQEEQDILFEKGIDNLADKLVITILLQTGIRQSEFEDYFNNVDMLLENNTIEVIGKSSTSRVIPVTKEIKELAKEFKDRSKVSYIWPTSYTAKDKRLKNISKKCGISLNMHMFRATFATMWVWKGHDVTSLQQAMGHSSLSQLDSYIAKNQMRMLEDWNSYAKGEDYTDRNFLIAKIKMLESKNRKLKEELKLCQ